MNSSCIIDSTEKPNDTRLTMVCDSECRFNQIKLDPSIKTIKILTKRFHGIEEVCYESRTIEHSFSGL
jgi:hypothetical protein